MKRSGSEGAKHLFLLSISFLILVPFYIMLVISVKDLRQFLRNILYASPPFHWENYVQGWRAVGPYILNTVVVAIAVVFFGILFSALSAYAFARFEFPGKRFLFGMLISLLMIPGVLNLIPQYTLASKLRIVNTPWALILFYIAGRQVINIFILRTFFRSIPKGLFEAAQIDGASELSIFVHIAIPLSKPILGTLAIMTVIFVWNDYIWPLVAASDYKTISIGLAYLTQQHSTAWGPLMAGYTIASLPLIFLFAFTMRFFIQGLTSGAIKA